MHKGVKHTKVMEGYQDFARSEGAEAKKYVDSIRKNDPFAEGLDDVMDEESRRRERNFYVKGTTVSKEKTVDTPLNNSSTGKSKKTHGEMSGGELKDHSMVHHTAPSPSSRKDKSKTPKKVDPAKGKLDKRVYGSPLDMMKNASPFEMSCWKGYKAKGKKKSPSGKKTKSGKIKMVNNCVKK